MKRRTAAILFALALCALGGEAFAQAKQGVTLGAIKKRGYVVAGVNSSNAGWSFLKPDGSYDGFEIEFARALATAVFNDPSKVQYRPLTSKERFTALQTGEIDVLIRTATHTLTRDTDLSLNFTSPYFYDGQSFLVRKDSGIKRVEDLDGATIAVLTGSTGEITLAGLMASKGLKYKPLLFESLDELKNAFFAGRADAWTSDKSSLAATAATYPNAADYMTLDATVSKEPLAMGVRHGDDQWYDIAQWTLYALFFAEERGITSANVQQTKASTKDPDVQAFLGATGQLGSSLGLSNDWAFNVIKKVGNYGEIYDKHLGPKTIFNIPRGLNKPWTQGGLLYAPPFK
jgi:general L-amino acid transport system substrate-binding protein